MNKVLIPTKLSDVAANTLKTAGYEVIQDADTPLEKQVAAHPDAVALIVRSEKVTPEIMDALPSLKLVVRAGAGYDNIDIVYARKKNVDVMNTPGANSNAVAEEVMAMILAYYRHIVQADATTREGLWEKKKYMGSELTKRRWASSAWATSAATSSSAFRDLNPFCWATTTFWHASAP